MKAIVCTEYGPPDVLRLEEVEKPTPRDNEVLIRIHATTVTSGDVKLRSMDFPAFYQLPVRMMLGFRKPRNPIPGHELAGVIESVGRDVSRYRAGDQVFGTTGLQSGTYAEYICLPEDGQLAMKPVNMTYEEAAAVPVGASTALHFLRKGNIRSGMKVLIYGASGSVGTFAVQLARHFGAEVTGVCSTANLELVRSLGAREVIDYTREDYASGEATYDIIFDTVGKSSFTGSLKSLKEDGTYLLGAVFKVSWHVRGPWVSMTSRRSVVSGVAKGASEDLVFLKELIEAGELRSVIDRRFTLEEVPEAHRHVDNGHKKGNTVVTLGHDTGS